MKTDILPAYLPVYIFNVLHIASMIGLSFKVINDYMRNTIFIEYNMVFLLMTLISMASGNFGVMFRLHDDFLILDQANGSQ
jgi:hypothetical protein